MLPGMDLFWTAATAGCRIGFADGRAWADGYPEKERFLSEKRLVPDEGWLVKLASSYEVLEQSAGSRYVISSTHIRGLVDVLASLIGIEETCIRMMDSPEEVALLLKACLGIVMKLTKYQMKVVPRYEGGCFNRFSIWAPGETIAFQEDAAVLLSPDLYRELVFPLHVEMGTEIEYAVIHLHSPCVPFTVPLLLDIEPYRAIQVRIDPTGPTLNELLPVFKEVQKKKSLIVSGDFAANDIEKLTSHLNPGWLLVHTNRDAIKQFCQENQLRSFGG
jgi:hypothetical protein